MRYPVAERQPVVDELHAQRVPDPYRWLEEPGSAETRRWLADQEQLWCDHAASLPARERFHARVAELTDVGMVSAPVWRGERRFWLGRTAGQEHPVLHTAEPGGAEQVLLDPVALDPTGLTSLDAWHPDRDGGRLAYQVSRRGDEHAELYVLDVASGKLLDGPIDRCRYSPIAWLPGGQYFFYVRSESGGVGQRRRVYLHRVGRPVDTDVLVLGADRDDTTAYGLGISEDGRWLLISASVGAAAGNDLWLADLAASDASDPQLRVVHEGDDSRTVASVGRDGRLYLVTNLDAPFGRLCVADPQHPGRLGWLDLVGADPDAVLVDFAILDDPELARPVLLVGRVRQAVGEISIHDLATGRRLAEVPLPGAGTLGPMSTVPGGGHEAWFTYTDSVTPPTVYRFDARTGETSVWAGPAGAGAVTGIRTHHLTCRSADGTPLRVTVLERAAAGAGERPAILYGYGGFGLSLTPTYSAYVLAWVEAGGVFALAHLRGGGEHGERWHRNGRLDGKQRVIDDFVAAGRCLIENGWTTAGQLGACGESNGGLVVGAALTQHPELFAAVVCSAPLLDMVRYERSGLGAAWRAEYGSADDPEQLRWLLAYSPYHHVRQGVDYPAVLFTVFGADSRVDPMHARKMCAAMQWATAGTRPILLREEPDVGHGSRATSRSVALAADMLAFLARHTGLAAP
ncbi:MAG TPA: prolyl oligopeptidase family serine peptidase [Micromonosporaceae bacterium]|nr:prolyl oligopeptidase family serine peptidase [Micromonosporaceae bacterium]